MNTILLTAQSTVTNAPGIEFWMSLIALFVSFGTAIFEYFWNDKINRTNLESEFFKEIYGEYIMTEIPKARKMIRYNDKRISDTGELCDVLNGIRQSSLFYLYEDKKFYDELIGDLQELEDELVKREGQVLEDHQYADFVSDLQKRIEKIYSIIMGKYTGKKRIRKK